MIISLAVLVLFFLLVLVIHIFKLDAVIANIDFEQIDERYRDTVRRRWFVWTEMMVIVLGIWTTIFTFIIRTSLFYRRYCMLFHFKFGQVELSHKKI